MRMSEDNLHQTTWQEWIDEIATALRIDPAVVDVAAIHELTRTISHDFVRPMAPVGAYLWGLARSAHPERDPVELRDAIVASVPPATPAP